MEKKKKLPEYIVYSEKNDEKGKVIRQKVGAVWEFEKDGKKRLRISLNLLGQQIFLSAYKNEPKEEKK
ncbi:MAG: hypothetical protein QXG86_03785 [Candidatus Woesearchaeota archaeon]